MQKSILILAVMLFCIEQPAVGKTKHSKKNYKNTEVYLKTKLKKKPTDMNTRIKLAYLLSKKNKHAELINLLNPFKEDLPASLLLKLASSYRKTANIPMELETLKIISEKKPNSYIPYYLMANAHQLLKKTTTSSHVLRRSEIQHNKKIDITVVKLYRKAIDTQPKQRAPYDALLKLFKNDNSHYEAQHLIETMISVFGPQGEFYSELCRLFSIQAFFTETRETCTKAIKLDPKLPDNHVYLANTFYDDKDLPKTIKTLKKAAAKFPKSYLIQISLAEKYQLKKSYYVAAKHYDKAAQLNPKSYKAQIGKADSYFRIQKFDKSLQAFKAACQLSHNTKHELRVAVARLKKQSNYAWVAKFNDQIILCK